MKVTDIISGKIDLKPLHKEKKGETGKINKLSEGLKSNNRDALSISHNQSQDLVKLQEMQSSYFKSNHSLEGFNEMSAIIRKFEQVPEDQKDWNALNQELKSVVAKTLFNGESVISYLSTNVNDEKSLYTLKTNLSNEVQAVQARLSQAKKQISTYLIREANRDAVVGYDPAKQIQTIKQDLANQDVSRITGNFNNIQRLLNYES